MDNKFTQNRFKVWSAWLIVSLFLAYQYVLRVLPNILMPYLQEHFDITASQFGQFSGLYYIGYTIMHIPLGIMLDFIGPRLVISCSVILVVLGFLPMVYSDSWFLNSAGRFLVGCSSSAAALGLFKVIRIGFPSNKFAFILGISITIGFFGAAYGGPLVGHLSQLFGQKLVLKSLFIIGVILSALCFITLPNSTTVKDESVLDEIKELFSHKKWILIAALGGLMVGPIEGFADGWATTFLTVLYTWIDARFLSLLPASILMGLALGAPLIGWLGSKTQAYYTLIGICGVGMFLGFMLIMFGQINNLSTLIILFFLIGTFSSYQTLVIYKSSSLVPEKFVGLTTACANMVIMIFGYFFHTIIGEVVQLYSYDKYYTPESLLMGISIIPICLFIASCAFIYFAFMSRKKSIN